MKKINCKIILLGILLFLVILPNFSKAANVSVGKVKKINIAANDTTSITLSWKNVNKASGYRIYKYNNNKKKFEYYGKTTKNTYTLKSLKSAQEYKFKIRAYRIIKNKKYYGEYSSIIISATKPYQVKALNVATQADTTLDLKWNKVTRATGYKIYIYNESTKKYEQKAISTTNSVKLTGLKQAKIYKIRVRAYKKSNGKKIYGKYSEVITTVTKPSKINELYTKTSSINSIKLSWNKLYRVSGYQIFKYNLSTKKYEKQGELINNEFDILNLNPATGYDFKVRAFLIFNGKRYYGSYSNILSTATLPKKITDLKVSGVSKDYITLKWSKVDKANGYAVYVFRQKSQSYKLYKKTTSNSMQIKDLDAARFYKIYVKTYATINGKDYYSDKSNVISKKTNSTDKEIAGIDVSAHNGKVNWEKVKKAGIDFAILRCGFGQDYKSQDDKRFAEYISECERLQIPYGVYLYSYALNTTHASSEADHALRLLKGHKPQYGIWFDMEDADNYKKKNGMPSDKTLVNICVTFCDKMIKNGYDTGIYASLSWFNNQLKDSKLDKYEKWVAQWNDSCSYTKEYVMWQYTSDGMIDGISGRVDMNILYIKERPEDPIVLPEPENPTTPEEPIIPENPTIPEEPISQ